MQIDKGAPVLMVVTWMVIMTVKVETMMMMMIMLCLTKARA